MLFGYPIAVTEANWLHECLFEMVRNALEAINAGGDPAPWPSCIPAAHRERLQRRSGLQDRLQAFFNAASALSDVERDIVIDAVTSQNNFPGVFDGYTSCPCS